MELMQELTDCLQARFEVRMISAGEEDFGSVVYNFYQTSEIMIGWSLINLTLLFHLKYNFNMATSSLIFHSIHCIDF